MTYPKVSIIVLNSNEIGDTMESLGPLQEITYPGYQAIVADNAWERDDVQTLIERFGNYVQPFGQVFVWKRK